MPAQPALNRGRLIALEGLDGVGKTTQTRLLAQQSYPTGSAGDPDPGTH